MGKKELDNLVDIGRLKAEAPSAHEFAGLVESAEARLRDADRAENSLESRFDLAYNAAHALSLAALRWHGYRPDKRYIVFEALAHTLSMPAEQWRILDDAHRKRNAVEYEGFVEVTPKFVEPVLARHSRGRETCSSVGTDSRLIQGRPAGRRNFGASSLAVGRLLIRSSAPPPSRCMFRGHASSFQPSSFRRR